VEVIYLLIPLSLVLVAVIIGCVVWAVRSGQFEDLDRPGYAILDDDDDVRSTRNPAGTHAGKPGRNNET
jgi:cbb3-type cytochrome oxidase maturation protein